MRVTYAGLTQLVECQLPKLNVASSSLVTRSRLDIIGGPGFAAGAL